MRADRPSLGLSALTVKSHLARIARKLGTGDRAEMVALAMRAGVIRLRPAAARDRATRLARVRRLRRARRTVSRVTAPHPPAPPRRADRPRARAVPTAPTGPTRRRRPATVRPAARAARGRAARSTTRPTLAEVVALLAAGTGPIAVDAERASGYRYGQRAYLVQLRREGAGTALIDPLACPTCRELAAAIADDEWVLHAASQDLACLAEVGLVPTRVFDTELAGRLAGFERVGLGAMVENVLGLRAGEGPLRRRLVDPAAARGVAALRRARRRGARRAARRARGPTCASRASSTGPHEEFEASWPRRRPAAARRPLAPHLRHPPDAQPPPARRRARAVGGAATRWPAGATSRPAGSCPTRRSSPPCRPTRATAALLALPVFGGRVTRRHVATWFAGLQAAARAARRRAARPGPADGPPPANRWAERDPVAAARLAPPRRGRRGPRSTACRRRTSCTRGRPPPGLDAAGRRRPTTRPRRSPRPCGTTAPATGRSGCGRRPRWSALVWPRCLDA